jgi:hypothetical protein
MNRVLLIGVLTLALIFGLVVYYDIRYTHIKDYMESIAVDSQPSQAQRQEVVLNFTICNSPMNEWTDPYDLCSVSTDFEYSAVKQSCQSLMRDQRSFRDLVELQLAGGTVVYPIRLRTMAEYIDIRRESLNFTATLPTEISTSELFERLSTHVRLVAMSESTTPSSLTIDQIKVLVSTWLYKSEFDSLNPAMLCDDYNVISETSSMAVGPRGTSVLLTLTRTFKYSASHLDYFWTDILYLLARSLSGSTLKNIDAN